MVDTNSVRGDFDVVEADLTDQRLLPFSLTPGTNDFHNESERAKLMPEVITEYMREP